MLLVTLSTVHKSNITENIRTNVSLDGGETMLVPEIFKSNRLPSTYMYQIGLAVDETELEYHECIETPLVVIKIHGNIRRLHIIIPHW